MKKTILFSMSLLIAGYFSSCEKEKELTYPVVYESTVICDQKIRLFVKDLEVTSDSILQSYFKRNPKYSTPLGFLSLEGAIQVTYFTKDSVGIHYTLEDKTEFMSVTEISDLIYWEKYDTTIYLFDQSFLESFVTIQNVYYNPVLHQYLPLYSEVVPVPQTTGYTTALLLKECYYVKRNGNKLKLPMLEFMMKHEYSIFYSSVNNSLNEDAIHKLGEQDTLLIQEYNIELVLQ
ncbi:MAG: hypothetical protein JXB00_09320 [Bacteroidales bacterium]|nr:hypothetical protein [Bacteroidales bacterium]